MSNYKIGQMLPNYLLHLSFECDRCRNTFKPHWLKQLNFPLTPVISKVQENMFFQRISTNIDCPLCGQQTAIPMPMGELKYIVNFYGDEAERKIAKSKIDLFTYSVIGISPYWLKEIEADIQEVKQIFTPHLSPYDWSIHMKKLWNGAKRQTHPEYRDWDYPKALSFLEEISRIILKYGNKIFKYNVVLAGRMPSNKSKYLRDEAYITLIIFIIAELSKVDTSPHFHFDSVKNSTSDHTIHQWAKKAFENGCENLMYGFISRGIPIPEPMFVPPASNSLLEIADMLSFSVARYHFNRYEKKKQDIDLRIFGEVRYIGISSDLRRVESHTSIGYPNKLELQ